MISTRALKQVIVAGVVALSYLQSASCELSQYDAKEIKSYWNNRISYFDKEIDLRSDFFSRIKTLSSNTEALNSDISHEKNIKAEEALDAMTEEFECLKNKSLEVINQADSIINISENYLNNKAYSFDEAQKKAFVAKIKGDSDELSMRIIPVLDISTSLTKKINNFDSHMMEAIQDDLKAESGELENLTLFKLAKSKILAADIVYSVFEMTIPHLQEENIKYIVSSMCKELPSYVISKDSVEHFLADIKKDAVKTRKDLLVSASKHFYSLFNINPMGKYRSFLVDYETINTYLNLLNENLSEEKVNEYACTIKPDQVVKVIVIEYIMSGNLIDYKNNTLFRNLRKIIENVFDPVEYNRMDLHTFMFEGVKQDEILDALSLVWGDYSGGNRRQKNMELCKDIGIEYSNFEKIQFDIIDTSWMYEGVM
ncbi:hypothetical protein NEMIN01_2050, partial [Nematocida minor]|uniref:uncharacterized protein n=1 Tax=Nematocida minor TaxID=1912983 RepID=UPI00221E9AFC